MKKKMLYVLLIAIAGIGLVSGITLVEPVPEPAAMLFFGTGLVGLAGIIKKEK